MKLAFSAVSLGALVLALGSLYCLAADKPADGKKKLLFYSQSFGFRHSVVVRPKSGELSHAEKVLKEIGEKAGYQIHFTQDFHDMRDEKQLKEYDGIILYTTGSPLINRDALLNYLRDGGALIGIHTATDSFHHTMKGDVPMDDEKKAQFTIPDWPEYVRIMGAAFKTHGAQAATRMKVHNSQHPATRMIEPGWTINDEIYIHDRYNEKVNLLVSVDTDNMDDATLEKLKLKKGEFCPVAWTNTEGKGRVFYTSLGHREDVWTNPVYQEHVLGGIAWALKQAD
jgi:uncharacterized protein